MRFRPSLKLRAVMVFAVIGLCQVSGAQAEFTFDGEEMRPTMILDVQPEYGGGVWIEQPGSADQAAKAECDCAEPTAEDTTNDPNSEDSDDSGDSGDDGDGGSDGGDGDGGGDGGGY